MSSHSNRGRERPWYGISSLGYIHVFSGAWLLFGVAIILLCGRPWTWLGAGMVAFGAYAYVAWWVAMLKYDDPRETWDVDRALDLRGDEDVLDLGCGLGKLTVGVAKLCPRGRVIGVDVWKKLSILGNSPERAQRNAELEGVGDRVEWRTGSILELPFPDESFDLVTAGAVLLEFWSADRDRIMREVYRVLRSGGRFLSIDSWKSRRTLLAWPYATPRFQSVDDYRELFSRHGLRHVRSVPDGKLMCYHVGQKPRDSPPPSELPDLKLGLMGRVKDELAHLVEF